MRCGDLHINVQDASGDRILAGDALTKDRTDWYQWVTNKGVYTFDSGDIGRQREEEEDTHPEHVVGEVWRKKRKRKFKKTPRGFGRNRLEACRIYGSLEGNKVQGDFHITAKGHGYMEFGEHLDHSGMSSIFSFFRKEICVRAGSYLMLEPQSLFIQKRLSPAPQLNVFQHSILPISSTSFLSAHITPPS